VQEFFIGTFYSEKTYFWNYAVKLLIGDR